MHPSRLVHVALLVGALATIAVACSSSTGVVTTSQTSGAPSSVSVANPQGPDTIPGVLDFSAPRLGGGTVEGADYSGKHLAIWFWAPW